MNKKKISIINKETNSRNTNLIIYNYLSQKCLTIIMITGTS